MATHQINTGFDVEILIGDSFLHTLLLSAFEAGCFGATIPLEWDNKSVGSLDLGIPENFSLFAPESEQKGSIGLALRLEYQLNLNYPDPSGAGDSWSLRGGLNLTSSITVDHEGIQFCDLTIDTDSLSIGEGGAIQKLVRDAIRFHVNPNLLHWVPNHLPVDFLHAEIKQWVRHVEVKTFPPTSETSAAIGFYLNLDLRLLGYYENPIAAALFTGTPSINPTRFKSGQEVKSFLNKQTFPIYGIAAMYAQEYFDNWHPCDLIIRREHQPPTCIGAQFKFDPKKMDMWVEDRNGNRLSPQTLEKAGQDSYFGHVIGNIHFGKIEFSDENLLRFRIYDRDGNRIPDKKIESLIMNNPPRGNIDQAVNFLPKGEHIAVGLGKAFAKRIEKDLWNSMQPGETRYRKTQPIYQKNKKVGKIKWMNFAWRTNALSVTGKLEYFVDYWPDADVKFGMRFLTGLKDNRFTLTHKIDKMDIDTGLLADVIGFLCLGIFGVVAVEVAETYAEGVAKRKTKGLFNTSKILDCIPYQYELFENTKTSKDSAYSIIEGLSIQYSHLEVNENGLQLNASTDRLTLFKPLPVSLIGRSRTTPTSPGTLGKLNTLIYRTCSGERLELDAELAGRRVKNGSLDTATLRHQAVYYENGKIHSIQFDSGVDLTVEEICDLIQKGVILTPSLEMATHEGTLYLKTSRDECKENNLSSPAMPRFIPAELEQESQNSMHHV
jgi:hypothetical protein